MAKTTWALAPYHERQQWLLTDGTIILSPDVETTTSQRRWRIAGSTDAASKADLDRLILAAIDRQAAAQGVKRWLRLFEDDENRHASVAVGASKKIDFNTVPPVKMGKNDKIIVAFEFVSAAYPAIRATLWITLVNNYSGATSVRSCFTYRVTNPEVGDTAHILRYAEDDATGWTPAPNMYRYDDNYRQLEQAANKIKPCDVPIETKHFGNNTRGAIARFLELSKQASGLASVEIPDLRDPWNVASMTLTASRTNYSNALYRDVLDMVQVAPAMDRLHEHLQGVATELTRLGLVANVKDKFDLKALLAGKLSELQCTIKPNEVTDDRNEGIDPVHTVTLDLSKGTFVVNCAKSHHLDDTAAAWEVAKFKAEISGETDVLLAYARAFNKPAEQARLRKIMKEREITLPE